MKVLLLIALLIAAIANGLILSNFAHFDVAYASTDVTGIIPTNTTWTKTNSPYTLTGPVAVNVGVTLTIEAGTAVNLNNYYIQVNGTLIAEGISTSLIQFSNGTLRFTPISNGWNDKDGSGCTIEYCNLTSVSISASNAINLNQDSIFGGSVSLGDSSVITSNILSTSLIVGNFSILTNNKIGGGIYAGDNCNFSNNKVGGTISAGDKSTLSGNAVEGAVFCAGNQSTITNNTIKGEVNGGVILNNTISVSSGYFNVKGTIVENNNITGGTVSASLKITNNVIVSGNYTTEFRVFGGYATATEDTPAITGVSAGTPLISGNVIIGGGTYTSYAIFAGPFISLVPAISLSVSDLPISNNIITGRSGLAISSSLYSIANNIVTGDINGSASVVYNNTVQGSVTIRGGNPVISNNTVSAGISVYALSCNITRNAANGITASQGNSYISDNIVTNGTGISVNGGATIARNLITINAGNNTSGISFINGTLVTDGAVGISVTNGTAIILNNTISNSSVGIILYAVSMGTQIHYNNIQSNDLSIVLGYGALDNIDATSNWWGTTNTQAINQTIHDFKNDFNLGNVTFTPFLTSSNPQALPNQETTQPPVIPEQFPSSVGFILLTIAIVAGSIALRRMPRKVN